jgi:diketogulonate reductase-like aldo/keto reductase
MPAPQAVPPFPLGNGVSIPAVGLGTYALRGKRGYQAMRTALDLGYRHLDTATMYKNEAEVGRAVTGSGLPRDEVFVTTKMLARAAGGRERQSLETSLRELKMDYVDLWLIHWPPARRELAGAWQAFLDARDAGLARAVGVSNFSLGQLDEVTKATGEAPSINQVEWFPARHDPDYLAGMRDRGVVVEGYSPLKGSDLRDATLRRIAERHQVTPAQVVLRWHLEHGIVIIPKSADPGRQAVNLDLAGFTLDAAEVAEIDQLA